MKSSRVDEVLEALLKVGKESSRAIREAAKSYPESESYEVPTATECEVKKDPYIDRSGRPLKHWQKR